MKKKLVILGLAYSSIFLLFSLILFRIQVIDQARYEQQVDDIAVRQNVLNSLRGRIFDTHATQPLVYNVSSYQIVIKRRKFDDSDDNIFSLANILGTSSSEIENILAQSNKAVEEIVVKDKLRYEEVIPYIEQISTLEGVAWQRSIKRKYIYNNSLSHVLGYVGSISSSEFRSLSYKGYRNSDVIGKFGIEKEYEDLLRGKTGISKEIVNVLGQRVDNTEQIVEETQPGTDLILTIDMKVQDIIEKSLGNRIGAVVVLRPSSGEIVGMASYPSYNPNLLVDSADSRTLQELQRNSDSPFLNRAIQSTAPPASTFKTLMSVAFLDKDRDRKLGYWHRKIYCPGYVKIGNRIFRCWLRTGHGYENYIDALADSCNVFFFTVGTQFLGVDSIVNYASQFGLGSLSNIDLPGEVSGVLPSATWKETRLSEPWTIGDTANLSIGQGFTTVTPIQLALMVSGIVNNGVIYEPHLLKEARDQLTGRVVYTNTPKISRTAEVDPSVLKAVRASMRNVAVNGSSSVVLNTNVKIAGKTGSGQIIGDNFDSLHSWYVGFGPYDAPIEEQVVVVTWVDAKNKWEWWGPKATNTIFQAMYNDQTYEEAISTLKKQGGWWLYEQQDTEE